MPTSTGKKHHNWTSGTKYVDSDVHRLASRFISHCNHLTPAKQAELDNLIGSPIQPAPQIITQPPDEADWWNEQPTNEDLNRIEQENLLDIS